MAYSQYNVFDVGRWGRSYVENRMGKKHNVRVRKLANETLAAEEAEADEREAEHRHGGGFGNVIFRSVGRDSAARAGAGASAGVVDDGETVALPGRESGGIKGKVEPQAREVRGKEVGS